MERERLIDKILIKALQIKAYSDWQSSFKQLDSVQTSITKNKSSKFAQTITEANQNWLTYTFIEKFDVLSLLSDKVCSLYKINSVHIHNLKSWHRYLPSNYLHEEVALITGNSLGFYQYFKHGALVSSNIVFPNDDFNETADFFSFIKTFAHELAHAIIDERHRVLKKSLKKYDDGWENQMSILEQTQIDPVETAAFLKLYESKTASMRAKKEAIDKNMANNFYLEEDENTQKVRYTDEQAYIDNIMTWEERCAESFGLYFVNILKNALK